MQKQRVTIPLAGGIATGTDGKQLQIGRSEELQNVRVGRIGEVVQRNGTSVLPTTLLTTADTLPQTWALGTLAGSLVSFSVVGDHPANIYSPQSNAWATDNATTGSLAAIQTKRRGPIIATRKQVSGKGQFPDSIETTGGQYRFVIYKAFRDGVETIVETAIDTSTNLPVIEVPHSGGPFLSWGVRIVNGSAVFVYATSTLIQIETWSTTSPGSGPGATVTVSKTVANSGRQFDMVTRSGTTVVAAYSDGSTLQCFDYVPGAGSATFWTPRDSSAANVTTVAQFAWCQDFASSGKVAIAAVDAGHGLRMLWDLPTTGATRQAVSTYVLDNAITSSTFGAFTRTNAATGEFSVFYENGNSGVNLLYLATRESGVIAKSVVYRALQLDSKPFVGADGKYYGWVSYISTTQPTRFCVRIPESLNNLSRLTAIVAKTQLNDGYIGAAVTGPLCTVSNPSAGNYTYANTVQLRLPGNPTAYVPQGVGVDIVTISFRQIPDTSTGAPKEAVGSLLVPGGMIGMLDGKNYVDMGFNIYPEQPAIAPTTGGSLTASSTYYYRLVYCWFDQLGNPWRSAPSLLTSIAMGTNTKNVLTIQTYRLTDRTDVSIEVYRGGANLKDTLQLVGTLVNDPTVDTVTFNDTFSDTAISNGELLYTNGQQGNQPLANDCVPGTTSIAVSNTRLFMVSNDNPYEIWVSNSFIPGQGIRFSEQNKITLSDSFGPCYAVAAQPSGVVVIFKANAYYLVSGDGPNQAGNGGSFTVSRPIVGAGTTNPRSVLETPSGIEFLSGGTSRAWYRVNTANQTEYIGGPIERYASSTIVGSVLIPALGETRYVTSTSFGVRGIVHDTIADVWMTDQASTNVGVQTAACAYGLGAAVAYAGGVYVDDANNPGFDAATQFTVLTTTPWIKGSDLDGYAMFRQARGVGESALGIATTISMQANFDTLTNLFVESATTGTFWDWEVKYPAKLSSFRLTCSYLAPAVSPGVAPKISAIVAEYGVKSGFVPASYTKRAQ